MTLQILAIHGIGNSKADQAAIADRWRPYLDGAGITVCTWESSGCGPADLARIFTDSTFRWRQIELVRRQVQGWRTSVNGKGVVVAHSMGQAFAATVLGPIGLSVPLVSIGGPLGHPWVGSALRAVGMGTGALIGEPVDIWNADDRVCALEGILGPEHNTPRGWSSLRIGTGGDPKLFQEHNDLVYLADPRTLQAIKEKAPK